MRLAFTTALLFACYAPPEDFGPFEGVPLVASDSECQPSRTELVDCALDGDTFDIGGCGDAADERFRLLGIDAPETEKSGQEADCYGPEARDELKELLEGREVYLEFDDTCEGTFGRTLAWVFLLPSDDPDDDDPTLFDDGEPVNINVWMVEQGYARLYDEFDFDSLRWREDLEDAEELARGRRFGLWGACEG